MPMIEDPHLRLPCPANLCAILAAFNLTLPSPLFARTIRIATFNLENGVGEIGSDR